MHPRSLLCLAIGIAACRRTTTAPPSDAGPAPVAAIDSSAPASTEGEARALVDGWLAAQNTSAFPAYEALYAPRFEGIRRSGAQTVRRDRAQWMKERARMFERATTVTATNLRVVAVKGGADVTFVQTWAQEGYKDEGPKHMVLVRDGGRLKIAREELLASIIAAPAAIGPERFAFAIHAATTELVLTDAPESGWEIGAARTVTMRGPVVTRRDVDPAKLPEALAAFRGKRVELFGHAGVVCEGTVESLGVLGRVVPHFGTIASWTGTGDHDGEPPAPPAQIAREAWALSGQDGAVHPTGRVLVGDVHPTSGDCKDALWGRVATADKPVLVAAHTDAKLEARARAALTTTALWRDIQTRYERERAPSDPAKWHDFEATLVARVFTFPSGGTIVTLSIHAGAGCASFNGDLSGAWEDKAGALVPLKDPEAATLEPVSAGDVDGDGLADLVFPERVIRRKASKLTLTNQLVVPNLDCGC